MFNLPNVVPIEAFKNLRTIAGDNKINIATLSHINNSQLVDWSNHIGHFWTRKIHPIMSK
jgi:hypothetical protein